MTPHITIINHSTLVTGSELYRMATACSSQLRNEACPMWGVPEPDIEFASSDAELSEGDWIITVADDSDAIGTLGYHDKSPRGIPYALVGVRDIFKNGGDKFQGELSVCGTLSHELLELTWNFNLDDWRPGPNGLLYAKEASDAVEMYSYEIDGMRVSDFVTNDFFREDAPPGARFDRTGVVTKPFEVLSGGYQIVKRPDGSIDQIFGAEFPEWKREQKKMACARAAHLARAA